MYRKSLIIVFFLGFYCLWVYYPAPVYAQAIVTSSPSPPFLLSETGTPENASRNQNGIFYPTNQASILGKIDISGSADAGWAISFSYADNPTQTWFTLFQSKEPVLNGIFGTWDTTSLTDGNYLLRLSVNSPPSNQEYILKIRLNNFGPVETATPTGTQTLQPLPKPTQTSTPSMTIAPGSLFTSQPSNTMPVSDTTDQGAAPEDRPTVSSQRPTAMSSINPARLDPREILASLGRGIFIVFLVFGLFGLIFTLKRK